MKVDGCIRYNDSNYYDQASLQYGIVVVIIVTMSIIQFICGMSVLFLCGQHAVQ